MPSLGELAGRTGSPPKSSSYFKDRFFVLFDSRATVRLFDPVSLCREEEPDAVGEGSSLVKEGSVMEKKHLAVARDFF